MEERYLFRGVLQSSFEYRVLCNLVKENRPVYSGCRDSYGDNSEITFFSNFPTSTLHHIKKHLKESNWRNEHSPFTNFPMILAIKVGKYPLRESENGEGIVIDGGIDIDDLAIAWNYQQDNLENFSEKIFIPYIKKGLDSMIKEFGLKRREIFEMQEEDCINQVLLNIYGTRLGYTNKEIEKVKCSLKRLKSFFQK